MTRSYGPLKASTATPNSAKRRIAAAEVSWMIVTADPPLPNFRQYIDGETEVNRQLGFPPAFSALRAICLRLRGDNPAAPPFHPCDPRQPQQDSYPLIRASGARPSISPVAILPIMTARAFTSAGRSRLSGLGASHIPSCLPVSIFRFGRRRHNTEIPIGELRTLCNHRSLGSIGRKS